MIYTPLTIKAISIAYKAHEGQYDKGGLPYIFHPYHLAEKMTDEYSVCTAALHDVVEDTTVGMETIEKEFPAEIAEAVRLLTHEENVPYFEYIERLKDNPLARRVKLADLEHNLDEARIGIASDEAKEKWKNKKEIYEKAREILLNK